MQYRTPMLKMNSRVTFLPRDGDQFLASPSKKRLRRYEWTPYRTLLISVIVITLFHFAIEWTKSPGQTITVTLVLVGMCYWWVHTTAYSGNRNPALIWVERTPDVARDIDDYKRSDHTVSVEPDGLIVKHAELTTRFFWPCIVAIDNTSNGVRFTCRDSLIACTIPKRAFNTTILLVAFYEDAVREWRSRIDDPLPTLPTDSIQRDHWVEYPYTADEDVLGKNYTSDKKLAATQDPDRKNWPLIVISLAVLAADIYKLLVALAKHGGWDSVVWLTLLLAITLMPMFSKYLPANIEGDGHIRRQTADSTQGVFGQYGHRVAILASNGLTVYSEQYRQTLPWNKVLDIHRDEHAIFITSVAMPIIIPIKAFESRRECDSFVDTARRYSTVYTV